LLQSRKLVSKLDQQHRELLASTGFGDVERNALIGRYGSRKTAANRSNGIRGQAI
jgi:hypothetical protein